MKSLWKELLEKIEELWLTQKAFSAKIGKKSSEINELIKWKRKITIAWDILLSKVLNTPEKYWIYRQIDLDYEQIKQAWQDENNNDKKKFPDGSNFSRLSEDISLHLDDQNTTREKTILEVELDQIQGQQKKQKASSVREEDIPGKNKSRIEDMEIQDMKLINSLDESIEENMSEKQEKIQEKIIDFIQF